MSLMLPDWLEWVLEMLGYDWPTGDEDKMNESADQWREFAERRRAVAVRGRLGGRQCAVGQLR